MIVIRKKTTRSRSVRPESGFALIGVLVLIVVLAVLASVAVESLTPSLERARQARTELALDHLAKAIAGEYALNGQMSGANFGYLGDVGSFPPNLSALKTNPGAYATWNGPYIREDFVESTNDFLTDSWGSAYSYPAGVTITSNGSGVAITRQLAKTSSDLLSCGFSGKTLGANGVAPGASAANLIAVVTYPNGSGSNTRDTVSVDAAGAFSFGASIPIGIQTVQVIDTIANDTAQSFVSLIPRSTPSNTSVGSLRLTWVTY